MERCFFEYCIVLAADYGAQQEPPKYLRVEGAPIDSPEYAGQYLSTAMLFARCRLACGEHVPLFLFSDIV